MVDSVWLKNREKNFCLSERDRIKDEKFVHCCDKNVPKKALKLIERCDSLVMLGIDSTGAYVADEYQVAFDIRDKNNFSYSISKSE